jgi:phosphomannomutase
MKKLIVFDLDGTLAASKSPLDAEMASLLRDLLGVVEVAIISGGAWLQFERQVLSHLPQDALGKAIHSSYMRYAILSIQGEWKKLYAEDFTPDEKQKIVTLLPSDCNCWLQSRKDLGRNH